MYGLAQKRRFVDPNIVKNTMDAYDNHSSWIEDAIIHRLNASEQIYYVFNEYAQVAGYMGVNLMKVAGRRIAYTGIVTTYCADKGKGVAKNLHEQLMTGYDGILTRTQNPNILACMKHVCEYVAPITRKPSILDRHIVAEYATANDCKYDLDTFVCKGLYNGASLTGQAPVCKDKYAKELYSRLSPEAGDAIFLVGLFAHNKRIVSSHW